MHAHIYNCFCEWRLLLCHNIHVEVRGQLARTINSLLPPCESKGWIQVVRYSDRCLTHWANARNLANYFLKSMPPCKPAIQSVIIFFFCRLFHDCKFFDIFFLLYLRLLNFTNFVGLKVPFHLSCSARIQPQLDFETSWSSGLQLCIFARKYSSPCRVKVRVHFWVWKHTKIHQSLNSKTHQFLTSKSYQSLSLNSHKSLDLVGNLTYSTLEPREALPSGNPV